FFKISTFFPIYRLTVGKHFVLLMRFTFCASHLLINYKPDPMNRRTFIKRSSLATAVVATGFPTPLFASDNNRKLKIGLIGSGWYGMVIAKAALEAGGVEVIAVADVDSTHLTNSMNELASLQGSRPQGFKDYRELLEISELDAVLI